MVCTLFSNAVTIVYMPLSFRLYLNSLYLSLSLFVLVCCGLTNFAEPSFVIICFSFSHGNNHYHMHFLLYHMHIVYHMLTIFTCLLLPFMYIIHLFITLML